MAKDKKQSTKKSLGGLKTKKPVQTVRERSAAGPKAEKKRRIRKTASRLKAPLGKARGFGVREYHLPLPDNKAGNFLKKHIRIRLVPKFIVEAFREVRQVTWPNRSETTRLTIAVFVFAVIFASFVGLLDYGLGEVFKKAFVNK